MATSITVFEDELVPVGERQINILVVRNDPSQLISTKPFAWASKICSWPAIAVCDQRFLISSTAPTATFEPGNSLSLSTSVSFLIVDTTWGSIKTECTRSFSLKKMKHIRYVILLWAINDASWDNWLRGYTTEINSSLNANVALFTPWSSPRVQSYPIVKFGLVICSIPNQE